MFYRRTASLSHFSFSLVLLLLLLKQFVDLSLGHAGILGDDAVLVEAG